MAEEHKARAAIPEFVNRLGRLDVGGLAQLRRVAGQTLAETEGGYDVFFPILPPTVEREHEQESFFLVATLYALTTRGGNHQRHTGGESLGLALHRVRQAQLVATGRPVDGRVSLDRRVAALLDAERDQLPFRLRQIVRLLYSQEQTLDWERLLRDLFQWDHSDHHVQRRWAREYYVRPYAEHTPETKEGVS